MPQLLDSVTADGDGPEVDWNGNKGGEIQIDGVWDGAKVIVKGSLNGGTTYTEPPENIGEFVSDTFEALNLLAPCKIRATVSEAGANTNLSAWVEPG